MTREEAIDRLMWLKDVPHINDDKWIEAVDMAIEALSADTDQGEWKHTITGQPYCSNCEYVFGEYEEFSPFWDYCPMCGKRIKGGDDE